MPPSSLPARPNLEHLRNQAKDLLRAYRSGHSSAVARFRKSLSHYSRLTDDELRRLSLSLGDAQRVVAAEYGFQSWLHMRRYIERKDGSSMIEMTVDHVRMSYFTDQRVVVLKAKEDERRLPIWTGRAEGDAIAMKLEGREMPRPMTFSIVDRMIRDLGGEVEQAVVSDIVDSTFFATLRVKAGEDAIDYDTRPSDAIALAVHSGAPVFAAPEVLNKAGVELNLETGEVLPPGSAEGELSGQRSEGHVSDFFRAAASAMSSHWHIVGATGE